MHDSRQRRFFGWWRGSQRSDEQNPELREPEPDRHDQTSADAAGIIWNENLQTFFEFDHWSDREKLERLYADRSEVTQQ